MGTVESDPNAGSLEGGMGETDLQSRNHLLAHLLSGHQVAGHLGVDDAIFLLPADNDGFFPMRCAAHLFLLPLSGQGGVWIGRDHCRNWKPKGETVY